MKKVGFGVVLVISYAALLGFSYGAVEEPGPDAMSLESCIKEALAGYQSIKVAEFESETARNKLNEAKNSRFLPKFDLVDLFGPVPDVPAGYGPPDFVDYDRDWSKWNIFNRVKIEAFQPLFTFGKLSSLIKAADSGLKAKELQISVERSELAHKVKALYYGLVFGYSGLKLLDEMNEKLDSAKKRVQKLLNKKSSEVTEIDVMKLNVFGADMDRRYLEAYQDIDTAKRALRVLMGKAPDKGIDIKDRSLNPVEAELKGIDEYLNIARENRQELKQISAAVEARKSLMKAAKSDFFPTLFLAGQFNYGIAPGREHYNNPYLNDQFNVLSGGAALGLNQNLSLWLTDAKYRQAKSEYKKMLAQHDQVVNAVLLDVRRSYDSAVNKNKAIDITKQGFKDARSWMTSAYLGFDMGTVPTSDLIEAFVAYTKAKMEYFNTIFTYNMALSNLSRSTGRELSGLEY